MLFRLKSFLVAQLSSFVEKEAIRSFRFKKSYERLKNFILNNTCFSGAETNIRQPKIVKISHLKKFTWNGSKTCPKEKLSCFDR